MKKLAALTAAIGLALAAPTMAAAAIVTEPFLIIPNQWFSTHPGQGPYGMGSNPYIKGAVVVDDTKTGAEALIDLDLVTGTRTWTMADVDMTKSFVSFNATTGRIIGFGIWFLEPNNIISTGAQFREGDVIIVTNSGVWVGNSYDVAMGVPEPSTWAMLIAGFGLSGMALRARRERLAPAI